MGSLALADMLEHADFDQALDWHLRGNHFPPIHRDFHPMAKQAIVCVNNRQGETPIDLPNGITKTAFEIVAGLHLDQFLDDEDEEIYHPDGSDCDYCTYDKPCVTVNSSKDW